MSTIHSKKRQEVLDTPLLLFDCTLPDGSVERWSTHRVTASGHVYEARLLGHSGFDMRLAGDDSIDSGTRFTLLLSNVDGRISQLDSAAGWKGAKLAVQFGFFDITAGTPTSELTSVFLGVANPVEELTDSSARLSFTNRLSLQRLNVPALRIQSRCPWRFPSTSEERAEAKDGGAKGAYSQFYRCGYCPDVAGGAGNLDNGVPFTSCGLTRTDCAARGMLSADQASQPTRRFGGFAFIPPSIQVRAYGEKNYQTADPVDGRARTNDAVPLVYGVAWIPAPVIFARSDGNLTHCEVLAAAGPIEGVLKVVANNVEMPLGQSGTDMTATGWYNVLSLGGREGGFNPSFTDGTGQPAGDPHGSMACLEVVLPNRLLQSGALPKVEVLLEGMQLARYDADGNPLDAAFSSNPAWVVLDLLRRSGWDESEINLRSFGETAIYCDEFIPAVTPDGQTVNTPRFQVNLALLQRKSLNDVLRGLRISASLLLTVDESGKIRLAPESTLGLQSPTKSDVSNSTAPIGSGWPAYEFGDGLNGFSGILRKDDGRSSFRIWRRSTAETPNRLSAEFQDAFNQYQQDSLSVVDFDDAGAQGFELSASSGALGLPHYDQAARILRLQVQKNVAGNRYVDFETTVQAIGLRPGDLIALSHEREGLDRALYRVLRLTPSMNYERVKITAQRHQDTWYLLAGGDLIDGQDRWRQQYGGLGTPRPLCGRILHADGSQDFDVVETSNAADESATLVELTTWFTPPKRPTLSGPAAPAVNLTPQIHSTGGSIAGGTVSYYAVSSLNAAGEESPLSFIVRSVLPAGIDTYSVELSGLRYSKDSTLLRVYRGPMPNKLLLIAEVAAAGTSFTDTGLAQVATPPPDPNYDHARFQWRSELEPETQADIYTEQTIGNSGLGMLANEFAGAVVRIMRGRGAGQERFIASHTATEIQLTAPWVVVPDATSFFSVAEAGWKSVGITKADNINFLVPNRPHEYVQIMGVASNALGVESASEDAIVTRYEIRGVGSDADVPGMPVFGLSEVGEGEFEIGGISFADLANTRTIQAGTLTVHYWDELSDPAGYPIGATLNESDTTLHYAVPTVAAVADLIQIGSELVRVLEVATDRLSCLVDRGVHGTMADTYAAGTASFPLQRHTDVLPFARGFFGSPASGSYSQRISLPNVRIAAAEFFVTNSQGDSPTAAQAYTALLAGGIRTLSGGQYGIQYEGELAVMQSVAPAIVVDAACAVRDIHATLGSPPLGAPVVLAVKVNGSPYASLTFAAGSSASDTFDGAGKSALPEGGKVSVDITSVGTADGTYPGRDLTVTIRV